MTPCWLDHCWDSVGFTDGVSRKHWVAGATSQHDDVWLAIKAWRIGQAVALTCTHWPLSCLGQSLDNTWWNICLMRDRLVLFYWSCRLFQHWDNIRRTVPLLAYFTALEIIWQGLVSLYCNNYCITLTVPTLVRIWCLTYSCDALTLTPFIKNNVKFLKLKIEVFRQCSM